MKSLRHRFFPKGDHPVTDQLQTPPPYPGGKATQDSEKAGCGCSRWNRMHTYDTEPHIRNHVYDLMYYA